MKMRGAIVLTLTVLLVAVSAVAAPIYYDEAVLGDLSGNAFAPTITVLDLGVGTNVVTGEITMSLANGDPTGSDFDSFAFVIPSQARVESISMDMQRLDGGYGGQMSTASYYLVLPDCTMPSPWGSFCPLTGEEVVPATATDFNLFASALPLSGPNKYILDHASLSGFSPLSRTAAYTIRIVVTSVPVPIPIDIKPGSETNTINLRKTKTVPVALLSTTDFDAPAEVDQVTLTFGVTGDEASLVSCAGKAKDVNGDGLPDLVCTFSTKTAGFQCGNVEGILRGQKVDGTIVEGRDTITITPCK